MAKFHYAIWFGAGSKLVRTRQRNGIWLQTNLEPASVMEFGFTYTTTTSDKGPAYL